MLQSTLPHEFLTRMQKILKGEFDEFLNSYNTPLQKGIRVNTLKISVEDFKKISPFPLEKIKWTDNGFYAGVEGLGKTIAHASGLYYVQEPSAMSVAPKLKVKKGDRVLDMCSAPGGKGTQLAQDLEGEGIIFLNEINLSRAKILSSNVERLGIKNAVITCSTPKKIAEEFEEYFDKILVDAPCSGEGMFKKEEQAIPEWSIENIKFCADRQKEILDSAYKALANNGTLVYSTCTFAPEEDEEQVANFLSMHADCKLIEMNKLYPHKICGEGHFYAVIKKEGGEKRDKKLLTPAVKDKKLLTEYKNFEKEYLQIIFQNLHIAENVLYSLPENFPIASCHILRAGVRLGEFINGRFEPSHSLAMCLKKGESRYMEVDEKNALSYLKGLTLDCPQTIKGYALILHSSYPLGWSKCTPQTAKNKLPKGLRI